jgi:hypothetical protein
MVLPARVAYVNLRRRCEFAQEVGADFQAARAPQRLHGDCAAERDDFAVVTKQQSLHRLVIGGEAVDRQVDARRCLVGNLPFGPLHAFEQRHLAFVIAVDADAEVHLARIRVGIECVGNAEDRVARGEGDGAEQRCGGRSVHVRACS